MRKINKKIPVITILALIAAALVFYFLPVSLTVFENPQDPNLTPLGEILQANPLTQCASDISDYGKYREISLAPLFATYNRLNTGHYTLQVFVLDGGNKYLMYEEIFSAADLRDNKYKTFTLTPAAVIPGRLCFSLKTADSAPGNAVTVWLNSTQDPVYKITAATSLPDLLTRLGSRSLFGLCREALFGLFFTCLFVQLWLIIYLAGAVFERKKYEREKIPNPAHRQRARKG